MRLSRLLVRTLREAPADAEAASHQLLVRGGYIRRVASGVYAFLPLGLRVLHQVERIVRSEMDGAGAQELLLPALHPVDLWRRSGRDRTMDDVLLRVAGKGGDYVLGPTHEEVVTAVVGAEVESWRDLPRTVYQVQTKFRDEVRPRFGLLRTREFVMKDAYSFDASQQGMRASYELVYDAYRRVFDRCALTYTPVEASSGAIGGDVNHEFMVPSPIGEDEFARCGRCGYAANVEAAETGPRSPATPVDEPALEVHHTPGRPGIDAVVDWFAEHGTPLTAARLLKCLALLDDGNRPVVVLVPGDREVVVPPGWRPFGDDDFEGHAHLVRGYIGPMGLQDAGVRVLADHAVAVGGGWVTGANRPDHHVSGAVLGRDFTVDGWGSFAVVGDGDPCPRCGSPLELVRAVEAGHTFQLGLAYSTKVAGSAFRDEAGAERPLWMGCYGIGISRLVAVIAEEHHDGAGLVWPRSVAPYQVHLVAVGAARNPDVADAADALYRELLAARVPVLYDDRDLSPGVKFADADLLGIPTQLILGAKALGRGMVETKDRRSGARDALALHRVAGATAELGDELGGTP